MNHFTLAPTLVLRYRHFARTVCRPKGRAPIDPSRTSPIVLHLCRSHSLWAAFYGICASHAVLTEELADDFSSPLQLNPSGNQHTHAITYTHMHTHKRERTKTLRICTQIYNVRNRCRYRPVPIHADARAHTHTHPHTHTHTECTESTFTHQKSTDTFTDITTHHLPHALKISYFPITAFKHQKKTVKIFKMGETTKTIYIYHYKITQGHNTFIV